MLVALNCVNHAACLRRRAGAARRQARLFALLLVAALGLAGPVLTATGRAHAAEPAAHVLFLNSYHRGYAWSDEVERGLQEGLAASNRPVEFSVEYLDTRRFPDPAHLDVMAAALALKYADYPLDLVVVSDNAAFDFAMKHRAELFPDTPIVFTGFNSFRPAVLEGIDNVTGVNEEIDLAATIDLALAVQPATRTLAFITSTGDVSSARIAEVVETTVLSQYRDRYDVVVLKNASMAEISARLAELPQESAVFLAGQTRDQGEGRALTPVENGQLIAAASPFPVYTFWNFHLNTGVLGGHILTGADQGQAAAELALEILSGTPADAIPVVMTSPATELFDFTVMERFGIAASALPAERGRHQSSVVAVGQLPLATHGDHRRPRGPDSAHWHPLPGHPPAARGIAGVGSRAFPARAKGAGAHG